MLESSSFSYQISKFFLGFITFVFLPFATIGYFFLAYNSDRIDFYFFGGLFLIISIILIPRYKRLRNNFYEVKMNDEKIILKKGYKTKIEAKWDDITLIKRVPFITPPVYYLKIKNTDTTFFFPSSSSQSYFSFSIEGISIIRDISKMGKHIRKMKRFHHI